MMSAGATAKDQTVSKYIRRPASKKLTGNVSEFGQRNKQLVIRSLRDWAGAFEGQDKRRWA